MYVCVSANESVLSCMYVCVSANESVLSWWFRDKNASLVADSLYVGLKLSDDARLWEILITGN